MIQLLRFHIDFSKKILLTTSSIVILLYIMNTSQVIALDLLFLTALLSAYLPIILVSHLLNGPFSTLIRTFPIPFKQFVQSMFLFMAILFALIIIPILFGLSYQYAQGDANSFHFYFTLGLFSYVFLSTGSILKAHFKSPHTNNAFARSNAIFCLIFIGISQTVLGIFFTVSKISIAGAFLVPAVCLFLFYRQYKASIPLYEKAEFL